MSRARFALLVGFGTSGLLAVACNLIVGVEDVTVASARPPGDDSSDDDDVGDDSGTTTQKDSSVDTPAPAAEWALGAGTEFTCAANVTSGKTFCWGNNQKGQLGGVSGLKFSQPVPVSDVSAATLLGTGSSHACALTGGMMRCWGNNGDGQLGTGSKKTDGGGEPPIAVSALTSPMGMDGTDSTSCFVDSDAVKCVGRNAQGQFGDGTTTPSLALKTVTLPEKAAGVAMGTGHVCAWTVTGTAYCWGTNGKGQVGNGTDTNQPTPFALKLTGVQQVVCGAEFACALLKDRSVQCWGDNLYRELGRNAGEPKSPGAVSSITSAIQLAAGDTHVCALLANHTVQCWGNGGKGQLGNSNTNGTSSVTPVPLSINDNKQFVSIASGNNHVCAERFDHALYCWGDNTNGQIGDNTQTPAPTPVPVSFP